ncbi:mannosyltransferase [Bacillus xiamenensis]|uniref:Glycosyltransferase family 39 protein n=1 Tax=Bacillus xiamenensis TaxID=1178537 RepID=A0AAC9IIW6_9BACI|nr:MULTISPECIES: glycosyltransferase family 39 protein [Bacillus]AOZ89174.1 mannosyltransferase [Bacillus xiamenensis]EKF35458.1 glycosyltransferase [Bacillus xiamenensis]MBG9912082.1 mannosyltransferase [Bacillus xiamenensis]MCW1835124.1 glycosyltransferase family 39 protein [Bacillus xiamenensis]MCY9577105.1 glycosyltransferase family 39 protein [Bacillus xiamenensis]
MVRRFQKFDIYLFFILILSAILNIYNIWKDDTVNAYYTAAVTSMMQSWHNFFFASFDPAGYVTVDKPPLAFWLQTISAKIFGLHGWSVILPQALAGIGSVYLIYRLVKPTFGQAAARLAALIMACTPIAVAVSRTNNIDSLLVFILLLATAMMFKAVKQQKVLWAIASFAMIGVGFNTKMLQAYMIVPALILFYIIAYRTTWKKKLLSLMISMIVLLGVSASWSIAVDLTSKDNRPYMGSSQSNSALELAFGYNGLQRLTGQQSGGGGGMSGGSSEGQGQPPSQQGEQQNDNDSSTMPQPPSNGNQSSSDSSDQSSGQTQPSMQGPPSSANGSTASEMPSGGDGGDGGSPPNGGGGKMGSGSGMFGTGTKGPLRLFQSELSDQISWLLPFAIFGAIGIFFSTAFERRRLNTKQKETLFWLAWLIPVAAFFSVAGFFHHYYLIMLAPPIAVLAGAGWVSMTQLFQTATGFKKWLLPTAIIVTTAFEIFILSTFTSTIGLGLSIAVGVIGVGTTLALLLIKGKEKLKQLMSLIAILGMLIAPLYWASTPLLYGGNSMLPEAGPQLATSSGSMSSQVNEKLISYLEKNNTGEEFLFGTTDATTASPYIIKTGKAVMALGGFSGSDNILTLSEFKQLVKDGKIKYFYLSEMRGGSSDILSWIQKNGKEVSASKWQNSTTSKTNQQTGSSDSQQSEQNNQSNGRMGGTESGTLYELSVD